MITAETVTKDGIGSCINIFIVIHDQSIEGISFSSIAGEFPAQMNELI